jgi:hypothetical protein
MCVAWLLQGRLDRGWVDGGLGDLGLLLIPALFSLPSTFPLPRVGAFAVGLAGSSSAGRLCRFRQRADFSAGFSRRFSRSTPLGAVVGRGCCYSFTAGLWRSLAIGLSPSTGLCLFFLLSLFLLVELLQVEWSWRYVFAGAFGSIVELLFGCSSWLGDVHRSFLL